MSWTPPKEPEYHKGEQCPYSGKKKLLCQEGFCCNCYIYELWLLCWDNMMATREVKYKN